jgi:hypothetical protein
LIKQDIEAKQEKQKSEKSLLPQGEKGRNPDDSSREPRPIRQLAILIKTRFGYRHDG